MATTVFEKIEKAVTDRVKDNWTATQVQYPNTVRDMSGESTWISLAIVHTSAERQTMTGNDDTGHIYKGRVLLNVHRLSGKGTGVLKGYEDDLRDLFRYVRLTLIGGFLQFFVPEVIVAGLNGQWWIETVSVPFEYME